MLYFILNVRKKRGDKMLYDTKKFVENLEYYAHDIFNYNARAKLEKQNIIDFIKYVESIKDILQSYHNKKIDKRFINKVNNDKFYFIIDNEYQTLAGDLIVLFNDNVCDCKYYAGMQEVVRKNNYLNSSQYKKYFKLAKNESSNAIFDFDLFMQGIEKLNKTVESINNNLKNQKAKLQKAIKLNNAMYDFVHKAGNYDFLRTVLK